MRTLAVLALLTALGCRTEADKPDTDALPHDTGPEIVDVDGDGYHSDIDCDDSDAGIHPGADEICDGIDNDCDGAIDEDAVDAPTWHADADADGYGDPDATVTACESPSSYVEDGTDCDDSHDENHPDAPERCDGVDNDCDGDIDEDLNEIWYADADADGYGNPDNSTDSCDPGEGWVADASDCDDSNPSVSPDATEVCNGTDDDCDGDIDEELGSTWYADDDGDGFGDAGAETFDCEPGAGWVADDRDCDDANSSIHPDATEICDELDNDCDGMVDDEDSSVTGASTWYTDADADGYGDDASTTTACEQPSGTAAYGGDCDDGDANYNPGALEGDCTDPADYNCDGSTGYTDDDGDGWAACEDCDDSDAAVSPDAEESCNGVDDDCDGGIDEDDATDAATWYADTDGDGYGDSSVTTAACSQPSGYVADDSDCDDTDAEVSPVDPERCDGIDNNCDGAVDEGVTSTFYADVDGDGYGDASSGVEGCALPSGYSANSADCDDTDAAFNPGAAEICDGMDNDCDGLVDDDDTAVSGTSTWYADGDGDGWGGTLSTTACVQPSGYVADSTDCDDGAAAVSPAATELCDGIDNDCDGGVDEDDAADAATWYADADADGFGDAAQSADACSQPSGYVADDTDCDDGATAISPAAIELCDGIDNDCDGTTDEDDATDAATWYADADADGYGEATTTTTACDPPSGYVADDTDCDDGAAAVSPAATELCDGIDNDCDGTTDEDDAADASTWFADSDGDGYGDADSTHDACDQPSGHLADSGDCDDADAAINPDAAELCNGVDDDCDGTTDEDDAADAATWYIDGDADGYGSSADTTTACSQPSGYVADSSDCDDWDAATHPGGTELCDGVDNDCDGDIDEGATDALTFYADSDGDGFGDAASSTTACTTPSGYVTDSSDCDDGDASAYPTASELCDGVDNDCDGDIDEGACLDISNVDPGVLELGTSALTISSDASIDSDSGEITGIRSAGTGLVDGIYFQVVSQSSGPDLGVFSVDGLELIGSATLWVEGDNALVIASSDDATIDGVIDAVGGDGDDIYGTTGPQSGGVGVSAGADGGRGSDNYTSGATDGYGDGAGLVGIGGIHYGNGGGGGGYCYGGGGGMGGSSSSSGSGTATAGGDGAGSSSEYGGAGGDGGAPYGAYGLEPLLAGSGGGGGLSDTDTNPNGGSGGGGAGGGAVQISVDGTLTVSGGIDASGGRGGDAWGGAGAGGAGGALLLEALDLDISGDVSAEGGRGGHGNLSWVPSGTNGGTGGAGSSAGGSGGARESGGGGGGAGWILLRYFDSASTSSASLSPDSSSGCATVEAM